METPQNKSLKQLNHTKHRDFEKVRAASSLFDAPHAVETYPDIPTLSGWQHKGFYQIIVAGQSLHGV